MGRLCPVITVQTPILHGLGQMLGGNVFGVVQIGDGARNFQDPVVCTLKGRWRKHPLTALKLNSQSAEIPMPDAVFSSWR